MAQRNVMRRSLSIIGSCNGNGNGNVIRSSYRAASELCDSGRSFHIDRQGYRSSSSSTPGRLRYQAQAQAQPQFQFQCQLRSELQLSMQCRASSNNRNFSIRATSAVQDESTSSTTPPATSTDPDCPSWNNPILHKQDDTKIKLSEYDAANGDPPPIVPLPPMDIHDDGKVLADPHLHALAEEIVTLNMIEVKELVDRVADHFGIKDEGIRPAGLSGGAGGGMEELEEVQEKTVFDLKLTGFDAKSKIKVIKEVRAITALGLKEAKALVDGAPNILKNGIKKEEAEELKAKLEGIGATIEIV